MSESRDGRGSSPAEGVADWVVLHGGAMAVFRVPSGCRPVLFTTARADTVRTYLATTSPVRG